MAALKGFTNFSKKNMGKYLLFPDKIFKFAEYTWQ